MKFVCDSCNTKYSIADEKVRRKILKIRCKNCANIIVVRDPQRSDPAGARRSGGARALEQALDGAFTGSGARSAMAQRTVKAVPSARAAALAQEHVLEPEDAPTMMSSPADTNFQEPAHDDEWYLAIEGHQFGPMSFDELGSRVRRGEARGESGEEAYVWRDGFDDWVEVTSVPELRPYVPPRPPPRGRSGLLSVAAPGAAPGPPPPPADRFAPSGMPPSRVDRGPDPRDPSFQSYPGTTDPGAMAMGRGPAVQPLPPVALPEPMHLPLGPRAPKTPLAIKLAAVGGVVSMLAGVTMVVYFIFFDRRPGPPSSLDEAGRGVAGEMARGTARGVQLDSDADDEEELDFSPMEVGLSGDGRQRGQRGRGDPAPTEQPKRSAPDRAATEKQRLLDLYAPGDVGPAANLPAAPKRAKPRTPMRNITSSEVIGLQRANRAQISACYNRALKRDYSLRDSRADVTLIVGPSGQVKRVNFAGITSETLISCLRSNLKRWVFRPLGGEEDADLRFPLVFEGKGG